MRTNELMLYKNMDYGEILKDMTFLIENSEVNIIIKKISAACFSSVSIHFWNCLSAMALKEICGIHI